MKLINAIGTVFLIATTATSASAAPRPPQAPAPATAAAPNLFTILGRSGVDSAVPLSELLQEGAAPRSADDGLARYAEARAAIRACHAERYAVARENVLTGRAVPLRSC